MAYQLFQLAARLPVLLAAGSAVEVAAVSEFDHHDGARRVVARRELDLCNLGAAARGGASGLSRLSRYAWKRKTIAEWISSFPANSAHLSFRRADVDLLPGSGSEDGTGSTEWFRRGNILVRQCDD